MEKEINLFYSDISVCSQDDDAKKTWFCTINLSIFLIVVVTLSITMKTVEIPFINLIIPALVLVTISLITEPQCKNITSVQSSTYVWPPVYHKINFCSILKNSNEMPLCTVLYYFL
jgi:hypothetical protein